MTRTPSAGRSSTDEVRDAVAAVAELCATPRGTRTRRPGPATGSARPIRNATVPWRTSTVSSGRGADGP